MTELEIWKNYPETETLNSWMVKTSVRLHNHLSEKYLPGTLCLNVKRDQFGIPFLFLSTFVPSEVNNKFVFKDSHKDLYI